MGSMNHRLFEVLTEEEQASLRKLCGCGCEKTIPDDHAEKFMHLGLAELNQGGFCATSTGRLLLVRRDH